MGNKSKQAHYRDGVRINETKHGTCEHQMIDGKCLRCERRGERSAITAEALKLVAHKAMSAAKALKKIAKKGERVKIEKATKKAVPR
jgi:hypothetical protein